MNSSGASDLTFFRSMIDASGTSLALEATVGDRWPAHVLSDTQRNTRGRELDGLLAALQERCDVTLPRDSRVVEDLKKLEDWGVVLIEGDRWRLNDLVLRRLQGIWFFTEPERPDMQLYFGDDSIHLARQLPRGHGAALDLCSGTGVQALMLAANGYNVTACDVNPVALDILAVNAALNGLQHRIATRLEDVTEPGGLGDGTRFDVVAMNPPLVPVPPHLKFPFIGDGGADGFDVTALVIDRLPRLLKSRGQFLTLGLAPFNGESVTIQDRLRDACSKHSVDAVLRIQNVWTGQAMKEWCGGLAVSAMPWRKCPLEELSTEVFDAFDAMGVKGLAPFTLQVHSGIGELVIVGPSTTVGTRAQGD